MEGFPKKSGKSQSEPVDKGNSVPSYPSEPLSKSVKNGNNQHVKQLQLVVSQLTLPPLNRASQGFETVGLLLVGLMVMVLYVTEKVSQFVYKSRNRPK